MKMKERRITDKISEIEEYLKQLEEILPKDFNEYCNNFKIRLMGERSFEKIVEAVVDLAFLIMKQKKLKTLESEREIFSVLAKADIISKELAQKLSDAKGMRNILAHEYGQVDNELVFYSLTEELIPDIKEFIKQVEK